MAAKKTEKATEKNDALNSKQAMGDATLDKINREFGKGTIMRLGDNASMNVSTVSTGSLSLDFALGVGGIPRGRITEIYGPESSGKTTIALHTIAEVQKQGGGAAFIDAEHALDPSYAKKLGVNINQLAVSQPDCGEQALSIAETLANSGAFDIIVIDSVAALVPRAEIEGDMGDSHVGLQARLMSQAMRKLSGAIAKSNCIVIFTNQLREKVGVMYGNPEVTTGGQALKFYASVRIDVRKTEALKKGSEVYGAHTKCKVVKNKVAPPFKVAEFDILYGSGISKSSEIIDLALQLDIISRSGAWFYYGEDRLGNGKDATRQNLENNKELMDEIEKLVRDKVSSLGTDEIIENEFDLDELDEDIDI